MFSQKNIQATLLVLLFSFFVLQSNIQSQEKQTKVPSKINVTMISLESGFSDLEMSVINTFKKVLGDNGLFSEMDNNIEFLLKVKKTQDNDKIILSVVEMQLLPKEVVEIGEKSEILYSLISENKKVNLPEEGKFIREHISAEYMKQFRMIWNDSLEIIDINDLESYSHKIASKYL